MDGDGQSFYGNGIKLWKEDSGTQVEHGQMHLGYLYTNYKGEEVKVFDHGLVIETSNARDGGFAIRDRSSGYMPLIYNNKYREMELGVVSSIETVDSNGDTYYGENFIVGHRLYRTKKNTYVYTWLWYRSGILVYADFDNPEGYDSYDEKGFILEW